MKKSIKLILGTALLGIFTLTSCGTANGIPGSNKTNPNDYKVKEVTLSMPAKELEIESSFVLEASVEFEGEAVDVSRMWTFSSSTIIGVDIDASGLRVTVTALKPGTAYVSYIAGIKRSTCEVKVKEAETPGEDPVTPVDPVDPSDPTQPTISLNTAERAIKPTESFRLTPTVSPEDSEIVWSSSNVTIASVDNGLVTGVADGEVVITATIKDTNVSASCNVIVTSDESEEEFYKSIKVYFFVDYNNVDPTSDETDVNNYKLLKSFKWYPDVPIAESGNVPTQATEPRLKAMDPAFPVFNGWSSHTIIDNKADLWDMEKDLIGPSLSYIYFYGIWTAKEGELK